MWVLSQIAKVFSTKTKQIVVKVYPKKSKNIITYNTGTTGISTTTSVDVDTRVQYSPTSGFSTFNLV